MSTECAYVSPEVIRESSTNRLCDMFELCAVLANPEAPTFRELLTAEIQRRYPKSFAVWQKLPDHRDDDLRLVINGKLPKVPC